MPALGYLLVFAAIYLLRQIAVGRVDYLVTDFRDLGLAAIAGDTTQIRTVLSQRGDNLPTGSTGLVATSLPVGSLGTTELVTTAKRLGQKAQGYRLGTEGPDWYDCSGLIWAALREMGVYDGSRFTTSTFAQVAPQFAKNIPWIPGTPSTPNNNFGFEDIVPPGAILLWPTQHMGVCVNGKTMYSARSPEKGIEDSDYIQDSIYFGSWPQVWILT